MPRERGTCRQTLLDSSRGGLSDRRPDKRPVVSGKHVRCHRGDQPARSTRVDPSANAIDDRWPGSPDPETAI
ncbi:hypothetical protein M0657_001463 [Pyricularia oryzae]|uniref:Uncharacterized protein n=3 Tax=Pyricularia oryzae TaxID=318829 RepID=A0A4P7N1Y0_PYROR|nr:hypothetical protein OOU_Y34scaffold00619g43 [Pyricularia oryzae Y34]KAI7930723.1 hypothetical protein M0657_001463 [Pyricularia oryzae]KAI7931171.1 hypothetical protein M9X92_000457 [Pyricularia oryzae]QBZ55442.1 hypothetical protein PoMZ_00339 [Pyricularia oryzae]